MKGYYSQGYSAGFEEFIEKLPRKMDASGEMRIGDWVQTATGKQFWPLDPKPDDVDIVDIAVSLATQNRFNGHTVAPTQDRKHVFNNLHLVPDPRKEIAAYFYTSGNPAVVPKPRSILRHTLEVTKCFKPDFRPAVALHDASEAYMGDIVRPLKQFLPYIDDIEHRIMHTVYEKFGLLDFLYNSDFRYAVASIDAQNLAREARDFMAPPPASWDLPRNTAFPSNYQYLGSGLPDTLENKLINNISDVAEFCALFRYTTPPKAPKYITTMQTLLLNPK